MSGNTWQPVAFLCPRPYRGRHRQLLNEERHEADQGCDALAGLARIVIQLAVPLVVLYLVFQRYLVGGLTAGGVE
jgi:ABC-type glycerol-3-phosphate transport system permease component